MRILVVNWQDWTHPQAGGAEIHLRETFGRLADRGHRVDLLVVGHAGAPSEERLDGINVLRRGRSRALFNYAVPGVWRRVLSKSDYDVVVDDLNKVPFFTPLYVDVPVVALVHHLFGTTIFQETNPAFGVYLLATEAPLPWVYRDCPFIAVSPSTAADLERRGIDRERIAVIPNGLPQIEGEADVLAIAKSSAPLFVYLGRLKRYKRVDLILEAFARTAAEWPEARLVVAGTGDWRERLERMAERLGIAERTSFPGWVGDDEKWRLLRRAWGLLYTSPKEGWGIASLEAQRVGTVAIVSDVAGLRDTVVDGRTGWLVPHEDVDALAAAMRRSIEDPDGRAEMEAAAVERARGYTWDAAADATERVLEAAAAGRAVPRESVP